ncbi:phosphoribosyl pyrophosphate synthase-associated protein 2-like isoform X1 [Ascaphus truei]|uniref:phosphoribosyl pyrophosphate synthase-associated protein 2-like isoform X1 n=2 Tax=Ascaphus truei TaxID=8439 RepID=UPI003F5A7A32
MNITKGGLVLFSANSNASCMELAKKMAERLGVELGKVLVYQETNRETRVQIQESVRGKDVFIIQTVSKDVNTTIMELLIMVYACRTSCAKTISGVIPYFPYSKQCKMRKRGSIVSKLLASMMCKAGLTHFITMDLHQKEIQGFFNIPVDNLRASPFLLQYIQEEIHDYRNAVIVAKSPSSAKRAQSFAERLRLGIAVIHGEAQDAESDLVDGRHSPPAVKNIAAAIHPSLEIPKYLCEKLLHLPHPLPHPPLPPHTYSPQPPPPSTPLLCLPTPPPSPTPPPPAPPPPSSQPTPLPSSPQPTSLSL